MHTRLHIDLPGPTAEGNRQADAFAMVAGPPTLPDVFQQAKLSYAFYHQNAPALSRIFKISREQAKAIVASCPNCQTYQVPFLSVGVNPKGLHSCQLWQTGVIHYPLFGCQKYIHVSTDTFSGAVFALAHAGESVCFIKWHFFLAFSTLGIPDEIKTHNGPAYVSKHLKAFFQQWGIQHKTSILHLPTGQSTVERVHQNTK